MQCLEVSGAVRLIYRSLGVKGLTKVGAPPFCLNVTLCRSVRINRSFRKNYCFPLLPLEYHRTADVLILTVAAWRLPIQNTRSSLK